MIGGYQDGGVWVVWMRVGGHTWTTIAEDDEALRHARLEAQRMTACPPPPLQGCKPAREHPDELTTAEAEAGMASVVYQTRSE